MTMQKTFTTKTPLMAGYAILAAALVLSSGCSSDESDSQSKSMGTQTSAMDVKQPGVVDEPKVALQPAPAPAPMTEPEVAEAPVAPVEKKVEAVQEAVKDVVQQDVKEVQKVQETVATEPEVASVNGQAAYATCLGCHGANAEGGVGPRLNDQTPEAIVAKLEKYKAGEQLGPMTGMMAPMAAGLTAADMKAISEYVVTLK